MLFDEAVDGGLQVDDGPEHAAFQTSFCERGEKAFDGVKPRAGCRREVEDESLMTGEPLERFGMLVGRVIVEDHMDHLARGNLGIDCVEEADELLMAMAVRPSYRSSARM
jgi:hypothetical protein